MAARDLAWRVEETCLNAWPGLRQVLLGGWLLRFSEGLTRRANSANPLTVDSGDVDDLIAGCEVLYRRQRLPPIFRVLSIIEPAVDDRLTASGYTCEGESCVLYGDIGGIAAERDPAVQLLPRPTRRWFAAMAKLQNHNAEQSRTYRRIVAAITVPGRFALLSEDGEPAALAFGVIHAGLLCYESVVVDPLRRRRGYARRIVAALAAWGKAHDAAGACLEVEAGNLPARALYHTIGLQAELYRYHYRRHPDGVGGVVTKT